MEREGEREKKPGQVMHNAIAHHLLTDAQAVIHLATASSPGYILSMTFCGREYPSG